VNIEELDFELPEHCIAQRPAERRDHSRLMVVDRKSKQVTHGYFHQLPDFLPDAAHLFRNRIRVRKARLHGKRASGGSVECLLLNPADDGSWSALVRPSKKLPIGTTFYFPGDAYATVREKGIDGVHKLQINPGIYEDVEQLAHAIGQIPLPPYIKRSSDTAEISAAAQYDDAKWYQTVFSKQVKPLAAAAPTAGLHFTEALNEQLQKKGHLFHDLDLTVGLGTFKPVQTERVEDHPIHHEPYWITPSVWRAARKPSDRKRVVIGTTTLRALEDAARHEPPEGYSLEHEIYRNADIFLYPPASFHVADALLTNFHLPRSTLLCLVGAFLTPDQPDGLQWLKELYQQAIQKEYRFFSYGDAMLIL
jgi:S-adenosylmethionine:tRNA ribosyltransferase-isomerase